MSLCCCLHALYAPIFGEIKSVSQFQIRKVDINAGGALRNKPKLSFLNVIVFLPEVQLEQYFKFLQCRITQGLTVYEIQTFEMRI